MAYLRLIGPTGGLSQPAFAGHLHRARSGAVLTVQVRGDTPLLITVLR